MNEFDKITHQSITTPGKMKISINNVLYELDEKEYNENVMTGNTNMVLISGVIYMANDEDYQKLVEIETLMKMKEDADAANGKKLE